MSRIFLTHHGNAILAAPLEDTADHTRLSVEGRRARERARIDQQRHPGAEGGYQHPGRLMEPSLAVLVASPSSALACYSAAAGMSAGMSPCAAGVNTAVPAPTAACSSTSETTLAGGWRRSRKD